MFLFDGLLTRERIAFITPLCDLLLLETFVNAAGFTGESIGESIKCDLNHEKENNDGRGYFCCVL